MREGSGLYPTASSSITVRYRGQLADGREFDVKTAPVEPSMSGVIPCWSEGLMMMRQGGMAKLVCPPALAYGERGAGSVIPPNSTLSFDVELASSTR